MIAYLLPRDRGFLGGLPLKYVIDSYAWIECFMGSKAGEKVKPIIEGFEEKLTPAIC